MLRVYDHRFLAMDGAQRGRLMSGTRQVLGEDGLNDAARAVLPVRYRLRAFCIQHGLQDELERLIREELDGHEVGAVVVGGRVYAVYPYLRGVPRQDADVTSEVGLRHRLDEASWQGKRVRVRGVAAIERIEARETKVELILRERRSRVEHRFPADASASGGFEVEADMALPGPGRWDARVAASALGVTREARFGTVRADRLDTESQRRALTSNLASTIYFTKGGYLAVVVRNQKPAPLRAKLRRRLLR
ncbi:hypothetical protein J4573_26110 [Actinomadura barringtoniae]|uniref:Uncharacterized protein n=2 Tax=Actinomadura barringtoniae TaxID=1427535 RepID=A0A939PK17_9ACTN|nr:hypothetical protein [Actinomadura barringtoniae]